MLLFLGSIVNRKPLALAIVLLIAGLAPASAIIGLCTRMPCCKHAAAAPAVFSAETNDCCTSITCYESPAAKLADGSAAADVASAVPAVVPIAFAAPQPRVAREYADTSPPAGTRHRLAKLSTLLI